MNKIGLSCMIVVENCYQFLPNACIPFKFWFCVGYFDKYLNLNFSDNSVDSIVL